MRETQIELKIFLVAFFTKINLHYEGTYTFYSFYDSITESPILNLFAYVLRKQNEKNVSMTCFP